MGKKEGKKWWISPPYQHLRTCCYFHQVTQEVRLAGLAVGPSLLVFLIASWCTRSRVVSSAGSASWSPAGLGGGWGSLASNFSHKYSADPALSKWRALGWLSVGYFWPGRKGERCSLQSSPLSPQHRDHFIFGASEDVASRNQNTTTWAKIT